MSLLTIPNTNFQPSGLIKSSEHNANWLALVAWAAGGIQQDNIGVLQGNINWSVTTNVLCETQISTSTAGIYSGTLTGVLAGANAAWKMVSGAAQTTGLALLYAQLSSGSSSIPVVRWDQSGTAEAVQINQPGILSANKASFQVTSNTAQTTGQALAELDLVSASATIPVLGLKNAGTGDLINMQDLAGNTLARVDSVGFLHSAGEVVSGNIFYNGAFDFWQRGTSFTVSNGSTLYAADRWYAKNSLGTNGVITYSRVAGGVSGSIYGASIKITTAPTAAQSNGCELYQTLENLDSIRLYNKTVSLAVQIKALGNVNQVGLQFFYKTSEGKVDTAIGSETLVTVNSSGFTLGRVLAQALGTAQTSSGVIGVRIRITAVSSGNMYDLNNGFVVEQAIAQLGSVVGAFSRKGRSGIEELVFCQRYFEKSYDVDVTPGTSTTIGCTAFRPTSTNVEITTYLKVLKRIDPTITLYSTQSSNTPGFMYDATGAADAAAAAAFIGAGAFYGQKSTSGTAGNQYRYHWTADAEI